MRKKLHHVCIQTECYQESVEFYTRILGFSLVKETPQFHSRAYNSWLSLDGFMIELQTAKAGQELGDWSSGNQGIVHMCFLVDDIQQEYDRIRGLGYDRFKRKNGEDIYRVEQGCLFKVKAPEGTEIEFRDSELE